MKKLLLFAVLAGVLLCMAAPAVSEVNNVRSKGVGGNMVFSDTSGNEIFSIEPSNRLVTYPSGAGIDVESGGYLKLAGTALTATATVLNNLYSSVFAYASHVITTTEDWVLSATEQLALILMTSSGSHASIIAPNTSGKVFIVRNAGNGTVTIKVTGGTGVSIATGKTAIVFHNGTDYVRATADATH